MSGIGAVFHRDGRPAGRDEITRMARALAIYGPERQAISTAGSIAFAYTHFSNTPESRFEQQPLGGGGGRFMMVFDGRLDNREELAEQLGIGAPDLALLSDSAIAMRCWEKWRLSAPERWIGEFAVIIWDKAERQLVAARDPFGLRTLSFHASPTRLVLASAPKGVFAAGGVPRALDEQKIADALVHLYSDVSRSFFKDVQRLAPAHLLIADGRKLEIRRYWSAENLPEVRLPRDDDYVEAARELLARATKAQLRSAGRVGALMSGGLDSPAVAITALSHLQSAGETLPVFTWVPEPGWDGLAPEFSYGDETPYVQAIAAMHPGLEVHFVRAEGLGHYHLLDEFIRAAEVTPRNALNMCWVHDIHARARSQGICVLLCGAVGNVTLSWSGMGACIELWRQRRFRALARELTAGARTPVDVALNIWRDLLHPLGPDWLFALRSRLLDPHVRGPRWRRFSAINPAYAERMHIAERAAHFGFNFFGKLPSDLRALRRGVLTDGAILELGDAAQGLRALHGIEMRDPMCDRRLVEWSLGVPEEQFRRNGVRRWLIKRMMKGRLPESVLRNPSKGRQTVDWHCRMTRDLPRIKKDLDRLEADPNTARMIDIPRLRRLLDDWPERTVISRFDDRSFFLPVIVPMTLAAGHFVRWVNGANDPALEQGI